MGIDRKLLIINFILCIPTSFTFIDYCSISQKHCVKPTKKPHIGCYKDFTFQVNPNCSNIKIIKYDNRTKNYILKLHNDLRNALASGEVGNYPPASRMLEMYWDTELESTACLHAQYCVMEHDQCRATPTYEHPGQNLRLAQYTPFPQTNITRELYNGIMDWFNEYPDVHPSIIEKYESRPNHKQYGHFTVMSKENNDRIGCCQITYESPPNEYGHLITCNYRETNFLGKMIYSKGKPGTQCKDFGSEYEISKNYKHLCTNPETDDDLSLKSDGIDETEELKDYCELGKTKCGRNKHIGCEGDSGFSINPSCKDIKVHNMTHEYKDLLIKEINENRDKVASGKHHNLPSASKMLETKWDSTLEDIACHHVKYCQMKHAKCLVTNRDSLPSQSLYGFYESKRNIHHSRFLSQAVQTWFNQSNASKMISTIVDKYEIIPTKPINDLALMIKEEQDKVGCCFITYDEIQNGHNMYGHMVTCVYEHAAFLNNQLYTRGKPASECHYYGDEYSTSVTYKNLCTKRNSGVSVRVVVFTLMRLNIVSLIMIVILYK